MLVFKTFFRIILKNISQLIVYFCIFIGISVIVTLAVGPSQNEVFKPSKVSVALIDRDGGSAVVEGLRSYLEENCKLTTLSDDPQAMQDALFYRQADYIAIVPAGFSGRLAAGETVQIEKAVVPDSANSFYADRMIERYLGTTQVYLASGREPAEATRLAAADLISDTEVTVESKARVIGGEEAGYVFYFQYLAYAMVAIIMLGISTILIVWNAPDLRRRNLVSPLPLRRMNGQLVLASAIFSLGVCGLMILVGVLIYRGELLGSGLLGMLSLNAVCLTVVSLAIAFLIGTLIHSYNAQSALTNVISLGMCFLCGVFVTQSVMSPQVLLFARFLPVYWYVRANNAIAALPDFAGDTLLPVFGYMGIQLAFAAAIFAVALFISKQRQMAHQ